METTKDFARKSVNAAFDSVNIVNEINLLSSPSKENLEELERNIEHLKIMMNIEWFTDELTLSEKQQIETIIL